MTQHLKRSHLVWLALAMLAFACSDHLTEEASLPSSETPISQTLMDGVSLEKNFIRFASIEDFESFLGEENDNKKDELLQQVKEVNFTSWREYFLDHEKTLAPNGRTEAEDILAEDDYISSLMNEDRVLQIGQYLFKINVNKELVFALHEQDEKYYRDLVDENDNNKKIMVFTTSDDVLPLLAEGSTGTVENAREAGLTCKQDQARAKHTDDFIYYGDGSYRMDCVVRYVKLGVYFKLMAKVRNQYKLGVWFSQEGNLYIDTDAGFKPRCRSTSYRNDRVGGTRKTEEKRVVYEKIKGLNKYFYRAIFRNTAANIASPIMEIRDNW